MVNFLDMPEFRVPMEVMPYFYGHGDRCFELPIKWVRQRDERFMGLRLITRREQFGLCYEHLAGRYFRFMPNPSGVLICPFVQTGHIVPGADFPGDIDLLILPYEGNELVLSRAMAVELKVTRASFCKQGKSPNSFGFSQAGGLLALGFPYVAVAHLITSDQSPPRHWREVLVTTVWIRVGWSIRQWGTQRTCCLQNLWIEAFAGYSIGVLTTVSGCYPYIWKEQVAGCQAVKLRVLIRK